MSKAFTKDDDDAGFTLAARSQVHSGPVTALGSRLARERLSAVSARLERAEGAEERARLEIERDRIASIASAPISAVSAHDDVVVFGAEVRVKDASGREREVVVASADEIGLVPHAASVTSPIARALLNARPGDVVEFDGPRGHDELTILSVRFPQ
jgi:transcription elongation factor GreB